MLKKRNRLPSRFFGYKFQLGRKNNFFSTKKRLNELSYARFAVVVTKKGDARASRRNQLKRKLYSFIRGFGLDKFHGYDTIVFVEPRAFNATDDNLLFALKELMT